mmetsp:Transcript_58280/g.162467  ORF Transcript_58280/g.162467 Transcript_58280/m.162467 type:complete len:244 (-) Transcript_58280:50-781(-)
MGANHWTRTSLASGCAWSCPTNRNSFLRTSKALLLGSTSPGWASMRSNARSLAGEPASSSEPCASMSSRRAPMAVRLLSLACCDTRPISRSRSSELKFGSFAVANSSGRGFSAMQRLKKSPNKSSAALRESEGNVPSSEPPSAANPSICASSSLTGALEKYFGAGLDNFKRLKASQPAAFHDASAPARSSTKCSTKSSAKRLDRCFFFATSCCASSSDAGAEALAMSAKTPARVSAGVGCRPR